MPHDCDRDDVDLQSTPTKKKSRALALLEKLCRPYFPENLDLILIDGATLLVRAGLLPRLGPPDFNLSASLRPHW